MQAFVVISHHVIAWQLSCVLCESPFPLDEGAYAYKQRKLCNYATMFADTILARHPRTTEPEKIFSNGNNRIQDEQTKSRTAPVD